MSYEEVLAGQDGVVGLLARVRDAIGGVGFRLAAEPEVAARCCQGQEVDWGARASGCDAECAVGVFRGARAWEGCG